MRIAVDARELEGNRTGVGRYLHELLRAWASRAHPDYEFVLVSTAPLDLTPYRGLQLTSLVHPGRGLWWEQWVLPAVLRRDRYDVLFAPGYTAPLVTTTPTVLVVHDVSFASHPEWFSWREGARRRTVTRLAARAAATVVTVSQFSKSEIEALLGVTPGRVVAIPNGVTRMNVRPSGRTDTPTVLFVGSVFNRRHVPTLIDAVALLARRGRSINLEIVGDNRTNPRIDLFEHARAAAISDHVRIRSYVTDDELADCYARANAFAFISEYEGFGLTPLEALSARLPIVVLDLAVTREVYGEAAIFVAAPHAAAIASGLERALFDDGERQRVLSLADSVLARHSWSTAASRLLEVFDDAATRRASPHVII